MDAFSYFLGNNNRKNSKEKTNKPKHDHRKIGL